MIDLLRLMLKGTLLPLFVDELNSVDLSPWTCPLGLIGGYTCPLGLIGGYRCIEACIPRSRLVDLKKEYLDKGYEVKVLRRKGEHNHRFKVALWWATMNNLPYDTLQFFWFSLSIMFTRIGMALHQVFSSKKRFVCSELIASGFYKEGDCLFGKPAELVLPADFDNKRLFVLTA